MGILKHSRKYKISFSLVSYIKKLFVNYDTYEELPMNFEKKETEEIYKSFGDKTNVFYLIGIGNNLSDISSNDIEFMKFGEKKNQYIVYPKMCNLNETKLNYKEMKSEIEKGIMIVKCIHDFIISSLEKTIYYPVKTGDEFYCRLGNLLEEKNNNIVINEFDFYKKEFISCCKHRRNKEERLCVSYKDIIANESDDIKKLCFSILKYKSRKLKLQFSRIKNKFNKLSKYHFCYYNMSDIGYCNNFGYIEKYIKLKEDVYIKIKIPCKLFGDFSCVKSDLEKIKEYCKGILKEKNFSREYSKITTEQLPCNEDLLLLEDFENFGIKVGNKEIYLIKEIIKDDFDIESKLKSFENKYVSFYYDMSDIEFYNNDKYINKHINEYIKIEENVYIKIKIPCKLFGDFSCVKSDLEKIKKYCKDILKEKNFLREDNKITMERLLYNDELLLLEDFENFEIKVGNKEICLIKEIIEDDFDIESKLKSFENKYVSFYYDMSNIEFYNNDEYINKYIKIDERYYVSIRLPLMLKDDYFFIIRDIDQIRRIYKELVYLPKSHIEDKFTKVFISEECIPQELLSLDDFKNIEIQISDKRFSIEYILQNNIEKKMKKEVSWYCHEFSKIKRNYKNIFICVKNKYYVKVNKNIYKENYTGSLQDIRDDLNTTKENLTELLKECENSELKDYNSRYDIPFGEFMKLCEFKEQNIKILNEDYCTIKEFVNKTESEIDTYLYGCFYGEEFIIDDDSDE